MTQTPRNYDVLSNRPAPQLLLPGKLVVTLLDFQSGWVLPMHSHPFDDAHITIIARGRFILRRPDVPAVEYGAGTYLDFMAHERHEFEALEDRSRLFNIRKTL